MGELKLRRTFFLICVLCALEATVSTAQTFATSISFKTLVSFNGTNGAVPLIGSLVQGTDANLYGTTTYGGAHNDGTVFKITAGGKLTTLHSFDGTDGSYVVAGLVLATNGSFYGTTNEGGAINNPNCSGIGCGTVFKITPGGTLTTLHSFEGADGNGPNSLVQAANGNFYGTTAGTTAGTVFEITPTGKLTTLYSFCAEAECADGSSPNGLVQGTDGNFYGTTLYGGANCTTQPYAGCGTVFKITPGGKLITLYRFCAKKGCPDGSFPEGSLVQAANGNFYGATWGGGAYGDGTVFEITGGGKLTTLDNFDGLDGVNPGAGLIQATDGNFYGTALQGGVYGDSTVFKITPGGTLTTLHSFLGTDGNFPWAALVQATNGNLYGTTSDGGTKNDGTIFSLSVGLGPFVATNPTSGKAGTKVEILGNNLKGTSRVTFNGKKAAFTVNEYGAAIIATVPSGATSGYVKVTTPSRTLTSNVVFRVP